jgi:hypothetical protein
MPWLRRVDAEAAKSACGGPDDCRQVSKCYMLEVKKSSTYHEYCEVSGEYSMCVVKRLQVSWRPGGECDKRASPGGRMRAVKQRRLPCLAMSVHTATGH